MVLYHIYISRYIDISKKEKQMNEMQLAQKKEQQEQVNVTGAIVSEKRAAHEDAEKAIAANKSKTLGFREQISANNLELDVLGDPEKLNSTLQKRVIDIKDSNKNLERFITGLEDEIPMLNHSATMAETQLNTAKNNYMDARNAGQDNDGITTNEREKLSTMTMVGMDIETKMYWVGRLGGNEIGMQKLKEIVPMI